MRQRVEAVEGDVLAAAVALAVRLRRPVDPAQRLVDVPEEPPFLAGEEERLLALHGVGALVGHVERVAAQVTVRVLRRLGHHVLVMARAPSGRAFAPRAAASRNAGVLLGMGFDFLPRLAPVGVAISTKPWSGRFASSPSRSSARRRMTHRPVPPLADRDLACASISLGDLVPVRAYRCPRLPRSRRRRADPVADREPCVLPQTLHRADGLTREPFRRNSGVIVASIAAK